MGLWLGIGLAVAIAAVVIFKALAKRSALQARTPLALEDIYGSVKDQVSFEIFSEVWSVLGKAYSIDPQLLRPTDTFLALGKMDSWTLGKGEDDVGKWLKALRRGLRCRLGAAENPSPASVRCAPAITDSTSTTLASFTYDALGRRSGIERASGADTAYGYDAVSRLDELAEDLAGTTYDGTTTFAHAPSSQIVSRTQSNDATYSWMPGMSGSTGMNHNGLNQVTHGAIWYTMVSRNGKDFLQRRFELQPLAVVRHVWLSQSQSGHHNSRRRCRTWRWR